MDERLFQISNEDAGQRLDVFLSGKLNDFTRSRIQNLIENGHVLVQGAPAAKNYRLRPGDTVCASIPPPVEPDILPEDIPLPIVYEDDDLLVVDKPKGMVVHPAPGNDSGTMVNALLFHTKNSLSGIGGVVRPGIVHRIDKDTSGLLVVAKNDVAHQSLAEQIKAHTVDRFYYSVVYGGFSTPDGRVDVPIGRHKTDRKKMSPNTNMPKEAVTTFHVEEQFEGFSLLRLKLLTGRTHQIRVHMAYIGHPVAGDAVYGPKKVIRELNGQCLHAAVLGFTHPRTGQRLRFESPLPEYFTAFLSKLRKKGG